MKYFAVDLISLRSGAPQEAVECPRFSKETLKRLRWSHSGSESGWYFWKLLQVALGVYVYAGHSGPACWFAANLTSFEKQCPLTAVNYPPSPPVPLFLLKDLVKSCFYTLMEGLGGGRQTQKIRLCDVCPHAPTPYPGKIGYW